MFKKTLQKVEIQGLRFFLRRVCQKSFKDLKIAFFFWQVLALPNAALGIKSSAQLCGLGFLAWPKANTSPVIQAWIKTIRQPKDFKPFKLNGFVWSTGHEH